MQMMRSGGSWNGQNRLRDCSADVFRLGEIEVREVEVVGACFAFVIKSRELGSSVLVTGPLKSGGGLAGSERLLRVARSVG